MRKHLEKIRRDFPIVEHKTPTIKDFIVKMRILKEEADKKNKKLTRFDQQEEEEKFLRFLNRKDSVVEFIDLEVYEDLVIWGGKIDDVLFFFYRVTPEKETSTFKFKFLDGFDPLGEENIEGDEYVEEQMKLFNSVKNYYDEFSEYWRNELNI